MLHEWPVSSSSCCSGSTSPPSVVPDDEDVPLLPRQPAAASASTANESVSVRCMIPLLGCERVATRGAKHDACRDRASVILDGCAARAGGDGASGNRYTNRVRQP